ncbi:hypothetical protein DV515_00015849 [Chloebia gouldiae]|uniref:SARG protein n=1 Tax=Chloebia gouldiae TaxID=44316 RepID=A0A3L8RU15_CHLGU|nr:hypothetical protein DV515_00015849 [Chloebia gouldiae]
MPRKELGMAGCNSGSCDSMVSTASNHSQRSDNSYDYLSVEEKECLMFLEETIGSLDAEGDSGVSTDDTDYGEPSKPRKGPVPRVSVTTQINEALSGPKDPIPSRDGSEELGGVWPLSLGRTLRCLSTSRGGNEAREGHTEPVRNTGGVGLFHRAALTEQEDTASSYIRERYRLDHDFNSLSSQIWGTGLPLQAEISSVGLNRGVVEAFLPRPGCSSLPRTIPAANGASGSKGGVHTVPAGQPAQEVPKEGRLDQASAGSHTKSVIIQPPDPFQDDLEWSRSSDAKGEAAKETKIWTVWGHPEKSALEKAPQEPDAKRGPPTAPKPRKLPPNIILKTSRNSPVPEHNQKVKAAPPASATSHPSPASDSPAEKGNSGPLDPKEKEKARREALEKLGLPQDRREPSAHLHPHAREPLPGPGQPGEGSVPGLRPMAFKSNTLERSGVGLGSSMGSAKEQNARSSSSSLGKMSFIERLAPSFLRSRPRPASLGPGQDFGGLKEQEEKEKSSKRRSHPLPSFPRPPRSAVSVKISPKGAADENRREALKKLGLLKE